MTTIAHLGALPPVVEQRGGDPRLVFDELIHLIGQAVNNAPRTLQKRIGPSEIGAPCDRQLAHKIAGTMPAERGDKWRAAVGTAIHAQVEDWLRAANRAHREATGDEATRYLLEQPVNVGQIGGVDIIGHCDAYDRVTATQIDWKTASKTRLAHYRKHGPSQTQRVQAHLYGKGWAARGVTVDTVMLVFLPRDGNLTDSFHWSEPYDSAVAVAALRRANRADALVKALGSDAYTIDNEHLTLRGLAVLADPNGTPDALALPLDFDGCRFCPLRGHGCDGDTSKPASDGGLTNLIA